MGIYVPSGHHCGVTGIGWNVRAEVVGKENPFGGYTIDVGACQAVVTITG